MMSDLFPGKNELLLNAATVMKAMEGYLKDHGGELLADVKITTITETEFGTFRIEIDG